MGNYITLNEANTLIARDALIFDDWDALTDVSKERLIDFSEDVIDNKWTYVGRRLNHAQLLEFPRDYTDWIVDESDLFNPLVANNKSIPNKLKLAITSIIKETILTEDFEQLITLQDTVNATNIGVSDISVTMEGKGEKFKTARLLLTAYLSVDYAFRSM